MRFTPLPAAAALALLVTGSGAAAQAGPDASPAPGETSGDGEAGASGPEGAPEDTLEDDFDIDAILAEEEDGDGDEYEYGPSEDGEEGEPLVLPILGETAFNLTSTTIGEYRRSALSSDGIFSDPGSHFALAFTERLELVAQGEEVRVSLRLDGFVPVVEADCASPLDRFCSDPGLDHDLRPERFAILWERDDLSVEIGDSHAVFGRGVSLTMRKEDILGVDNALRGAYAQWDSDHLFLRALGGVANPQNLDPLTFDIRPDLWDELLDGEDAGVTDVIVGAEVGVRLGAEQDLELGAHAVRVWFDEDEFVSGEVMPNTDREVVASVLGWHLETPALFDGKLTLYGEANALLRDDREETGGARRSWGRGVYGSAQINTNDVTISLEWKDYRDYLLAPTNTAPPHRIYSGAPSLDRDTERFRGIQNSRGGRIEGSYAFQPGPWSVGATAIVYGHEDEDAAIDPWDGVLLTHGFLKLTRRADAARGEEDEEPGSDQDGECAPVVWSLDLIGGYRVETYLEAPAAFPDAAVGDVDWRVYHGEADVGLSVGDHAFELRLEQRFERRRRALRNVDYRRGAATLTWAFRGNLTVSPILLWDTERADNPDLYPGLEVKWEIVEGSHLRAFGGRTPGGIVCSGGICRDVPPFEGFMTELVLRI